MKSEKRAVVRKYDLADALVYLAYLKNLKDILPEPFYVSRTGEHPTWEIEIKQRQYKKILFWNKEIAPIDIALMEMVGDKHMKVTYFGKVIKSIDDKIESIVNYSGLKPLSVSPRRRSEASSSRVMTGSLQSAGSNL